MKKTKKILTVDEMIKHREKMFKKDDKRIEKELKKDGNIVDETGMVLGYDHHIPGINDEEYPEEYPTGKDYDDFLRQEQRHKKL